MKDKGVLKYYSVLGDKNYIVVALDGSQIHCSTKIKCEICTKKNFSNKTTEYIHNIFYASIVSSNTNIVIHLFI